MGLAIAFHCEWGMFTWRRWVLGLLCVWCGVLSVILGLVGWRLVLLEQAIAVGAASVSFDLPQSRVGRDMSTVFAHYVVDVAYARAALLQHHPEMPVPEVDDTIALATAAISIPRGLA